MSTLFFQFNNFVELYRIFMYLTAIPKTERTYHVNDDCTDSFQMILIKIRPKKISVRHLIVLIGEKVIEYIKLGFCARIRRRCSF